MLYWAVVFFLLALVMGLFGFGVIASTFGAIAKILFWVFVIILIISLVAGGFNGRGPRL